MHAGLCTAFLLHGMFLVGVFPALLRSAARRAGNINGRAGERRLRRAKRRGKGKERENGEGSGAPSLMAPRQGKDKKGLGREKNSGSRRAGEAERSRAGRAAQQREMRYLEAELVNRGSAPPFKGGRRRAAGSSFLMH